MVSRVLALLICLSAGVGIGLEFITLLKGGKSVLASVWWLAGYFTILTNALVAILFGAVALRGKGFDHPRLIAGATLSIALVGVVFALLLQGLRTLEGITVVANFLLHQLNPILVPAAWLLTVRKGTLSWRDPLLWALYPLGYFVYALIRGFVQGSFAYPFIDVAANGWVQVGVNAVAIALGFIAAGELLVLIDRKLAATGRK